MLFNNINWWFKIIFLENMTTGVYKIKWQSTTHNTKLKSVKWLDIEILKPYLNLLTSG